MPPQVDTMRSVARVMSDGPQAFLAVGWRLALVVTGTADEGMIDRGSYKHRAILQRTGLHSTPNISEQIFYDGDPYIFKTVDDLLVFGLRTLALY